MNRMLTAVALATTLVALPVTAQNLAVVNGKPVPTARLHVLVDQLERAGRPVDDAAREQLKEELVMREVFAQEADKRGIRAQPDFRAQLELTVQTLLIRELFNDFQRNNPVTEADIQAEYDEWVGAMSGQEYRSRHILVATEAEAKAIITSIRRGARFEAIAQRQSIDTGSGAQGGDLDWAGADVFVPEFSQAMVQLAKGEMTTEPVQSQFGWHVIRVDDIREAELTTLEEVRPQITQQLEQEKLMEFQETLRSKARIQ